MERGSRSVSLGPADGGTRSLLVPCGRSVPASEVTRFLFVSLVYARVGVCCAALYRRGRARRVSGVSAWLERLSARL